MEIMGQRLVFLFLEGGASLLFWLCTPSFMARALLLGPVQQLRNRLLARRAQRAWPVPPSGTAIPYGLYPLTRCLLE